MSGKLQPADAFAGELKPTQPGEFNGVAVAHTQVVAAGRLVTGGIERPYLERSNGTALIHVHPYSLAPQGQLYGVATFDKKWWAVGYEWFGLASPLGPPTPILQTMLMSSPNAVDWTFETPPNDLDSEGGFVDNVLYAISASADGHLWAVGYAGGSVATGFGSDPWTLTMRLNQTTQTWEIVPSPNPVGGSKLFGMASLTGTRAWAVGANWSPAGTIPLIVRWDGAAWSVIPAPKPPKPGLWAPLFAVDAISLDDQWAVGQYLAQGGLKPYAMRSRGGGAWNVEVTGISPLLHGTLKGVSGTASDDVWAVGSRSSDGFSIPFPLILHWDGKSWKDALGPSFVWAELTGVKAVSAHDVWVVGKHAWGSLVLHWDGNAWTQVAS